MTAKMAMKVRHLREVKRFSLASLKVFLLACSFLTQHCFNFKFIHLLTLIMSAAQKTESSDEFRCLAQRNLSRMVADPKPVSSRLLPLSNRCFGQCKYFLCLTLLYVFLLTTEQNGVMQTDGVTHGASDSSAGKGSRQVKGATLILKQFHALLVKRFHHAIRSQKDFMAQVQRCDDGRIDGSGLT